MTYEFPAVTRGTAHEFIQERKYLKNVTSKTLAWYAQSFKSFDACETEQHYRQRILELRERGVSPISVNTWLRCINAFLKWKGATFKLPRLKEEQKILATLSESNVRGLISYRPRGTNSTRAHLVALTILDTGLRASEVLGLPKHDLDFDNLVLKVHGKGGKHRQIPFSFELRKVLWKYHALRSASRDTPTFLFGTKNNTKLTVRNFERDLKLLGQACGITGVRFSPHTLRHTFAVMYLRNASALARSCPFVLG